MNAKNFQEEFRRGGTIEFETPTIVLGSASPRRVKMLEKHNIRFMQILSTFDDTELNDQFPHEGVTHKQESCYARTMAIAKLRPYIGKVKNGAVITADTTVYCDGRILEKPYTKEKCREQHEFISGKTTWVNTAIAIYFNGKVHCKLQKLKVNILQLPGHVIDEICDEPETLDCSGYRRAGALAPYAISKENTPTGGISVPIILRILKKLKYPKEFIFCV